MSAFPARFSGYCRTCDERIEVGEPVTYREDVIVHADCEDHYRAAVGRIFPPCPTCHMTSCDCDAA